MSVRAAEIAGAGMLFVAVAACNPDGNESTKMEANRSEVASGRINLSPAGKETVRRFWKFHAKATELRVRGEWAAAIPLYQQALVLDPGHEDALYYLGNMLFEEGDYAAAVDAWRRLLVSNPQATRAHLQLASLYTCGQPGAPFDLEVAETEAVAALAINKEESGPVLKLGEVALLQGDLGKAAKLIDSARRANHRSVAGHFLAGYIRWIEGDRNGAVAALRQAIAAGAQAGKGKAVSASNEGDTRKGSALRATGSRPRSLFETHWRTVREWEGEVSAAAMDGEYSRLRARLDNL